MKQADNSLEYTSVKDEDGRESMQFYDLWGKLILERKVYDGQNNIFYDTYYVYDEMNNLRFVLSPEASSRITSTSVTYYSGINTTIIDQYTYCYRYDALRRCIASKVPGTDLIENYTYTYDHADRLTSLIMLSIQRL